MRLLDCTCSFNDDINTQDLTRISPTSHLWHRLAATLQLYVDDKSIRIQILFPYGRIKFVQPKAARFFFGRPNGSHIYLCWLRAAYIFLLIMV